jgi:hypothetical protein
MPPPRTEFLQIRITPDDRDLFRRVAEAEHLDVSTWARRVLLQAVDQIEGRSAPPRRRVAEGPDKPDSTRRRK